MMPNIPIPHLQVDTSKVLATMFPFTPILMRKGVASTKVKKRRFLSNGMSAMKISTATDFS
jgi:hypothetical protein